MHTLGHKDFEELKSQLAQERQLSYRLSQNLKSTERDLSFQVQNLSLQLKLEKEKTNELEHLIQEFNSLDSTKLQLENRVLSIKLECLEKDFNELTSKIFKYLSKDSAQNPDALKKTQDFLREFLNSKLNQKKKPNLEAFSDIQKKNIDLQEELLRQNERFEEEVESLRDSLQAAQSSLELKAKSNLRLSEQLEKSVKLNEILRTETNDLEEKIRSLEIENEKLAKEINNKEKKIKSLSSDLIKASEEQEDFKDSEIQSLLKKINCLNAVIKKDKLEIKKLLKEKQENNVKFAEFQVEVSRKAEGFEREKLTMTEKYRKIKQKNANLKKASAEKQAKIRENKDEIISDLQSKLTFLIQKNAELEKKLDDQDMLSKEEISLCDEISQLLDTNNTEADDSTLDLKNDEFAQELKFQFLMTENASLKSQFETLVPNLLLIQPEFKALLLEKQSLEKQLRDLKNIFEEEQRRLKKVLEETEILAINISVKHAEAATDRDYFYKLYFDLKKSIL